MKSKRILVVGCGLAGSVIARQLAEAGFKIDILDKRDHIAGNCYDYEDQHGIRIHKYGPHIFHTSNQRVVCWLSNFTDWIDYDHKVKAVLQDGSLVPFPPNQETLEWVEKDKLLDVFYRPYSEKMWGERLEAIDPSILSRVPVREDREDSYFPSDTFQKLPKLGYSHLVANILDHKRINVQLNHAFSKSLEDEYFHVFNSMPIDEYYDFKYGELPYRSVKFHMMYHQQRALYPVSVVNFTDAGLYTRATEWKNFPGHGQIDDVTAITLEEPCDYKENNFERFYPVKDSAGTNRARYRLYANLPRRNMTFIGRCGMYVYIDMDQAVSSSLATSKDFLDRYLGGVR